jgi:hypothetical protein
MDLLVAELAMHYNFCLATCNVEHFRHTGVPVVNPQELGEEPVVISR